MFLRRLRCVTVLVSLALVATPAASAARSSWCAGAQSLNAARSHTGTPIRIKARIARVYFASSSSGSPTFIDLGAAYPSRKRVTLVIWGRDRVNFPRAPERMFSRGSFVCAQGVVRRYGGVPQIEVSLWDAAGRLLTF